MKPTALTLRRLQSMRDEVLKNIRSHCGQVYKKPKDAEICRSAALIAAAEIADVLKEKYGIDISPEQVAGLGVMTEGKKSFLREQLAPRFPHLAPFLETFDWKKSSIDAEIARQEAQTQGPYRYFALKNLETLRNMRLNWADVLEGLGAGPLSWKEPRRRPRWPHPSYHWTRAPQMPFDPREVPVESVVEENLLKEAARDYDEALLYAPESKSHVTAGKLKEALRKAMTVSIITVDPFLKEGADELARKIGNDLMVFSRVTLAGLGNEEALEAEPISLAAQSFSLAKKAVIENRGRDAIRHIGDAWLMASLAIEQGQSIKEAEGILRASRKLATLIKFGKMPTATPPPPEHIMLLGESKALLKKAKGLLNTVENQWPEEPRADLIMNAESLLQQALELAKEASMKADEVQDWETRQEVPDVATGIMGAIKKAMALKSYFRLS